MTEEDAEAYMDVEQFLPGYESIYMMRTEQSTENEHYLQQMVSLAPTFDEKCLYIIELAHQRRHQEHHPAIPQLEELMRSGQFSRYLHEVWRTWRCLKQVGYGRSRDSAIMNQEFNQMRRQCLNTILRQVINAPTDIRAINDFCYLASYDNIIRYSQFMFGNSAMLEMMLLFPEVMEEAEP